MTIIVSGGEIRYFSAGEDIHIYLYIRHDIRFHKMFGADTHVCRYYELLNCYLCSSHVSSLKGSFISHVGVEVPVTDVDMGAPRRDTVVDDEHWT